MLHFLGIGAQKSGTTWLYEHLLQHPQLHFPAGKEVHYWDKPELEALASYQALFPELADPTHKNGEITPAYAMLSREVIVKIHAEFPDLRLLYVLRDPVDRAWSSALMALARAEMMIDEASDQWFIDHFHSRGSQSRGGYQESYEEWISVYPQEQLLLLDFRHIAERPMDVLHQCAAHIGVDPQWYGDAYEGELKAKIFAGTGEPLRKSLRPILHELYADTHAYYESILTEEAKRRAPSLWIRAARRIMGK